MTGFLDRTVADAARRAADAARQARELGRLLWAEREWRCYELSDEDGTVVTVVSADATVRYELVGVSAEVLH